MDEITRNKDIYKNPSTLLAASWYFSGKGKGLKDMVVLPYRDKLDVLSRYLQQLIMESLGKREDRQGNIVHQGISVYGNKGSTDQHAYVQQLRDGIDNFFVTFIEVLIDTEAIKEINSLSPGQYLSGFLQGTRSALTEAGKQSITITIKRLTPSSFGALIALFERTVGIYAELININAYNQPGVEAGKRAAANVITCESQIKEILSRGNSKNLIELSEEIDKNSIESIFMILRHLVLNNKDYMATGDWSRPDTLLFKKAQNIRLLY